MDEMILIISCSAAAGGAAGVVMSFLIVIMCEKISARMKKRKTGPGISVNHKYNDM